MTLTLRVDTAAWRTHVDAVASSYTPLVPVVKGNGYGFGRARLAGIAADLLRSQPAAADLPATVAVGTVHELADLPAELRSLVLTPLTPGQAARLGDRPAVLTVASPADVDALAGWRGTVVVKLRSSMRRFGAGPGEVATVVRHAGEAGLEVAGTSIHLPLAGSDDDRSAEVEAWLDVLGTLGDLPRQLWVSHLAPDAHAALGRRHPGWAFPMRVGSRLWHGDKAPLHLGADTLATVPVAAGERAGYHATPAPADGTLVVVGAGTAHGIAPLADGRSPFHFARRRVALLEPPHMHSSTLFVPRGDVAPAIGQAVDVQRPLISIVADEVVWT